MKIDIQRIKKQLGFPSDRPLTLQEKRRYMKFAVYPLFFLIFAGIVLLIYSPTEKEKAEAEKERGFNTEIPSPEESRMEGNKVSAYEREALSKKERGRKDTFLEMSELFNRNKDRKDTIPSVDSGVNLELPSVPETAQTHNPVRSSTSAYRDMNRSLTTIYTPRETSREEELLRRIKELEKRQNMEPSQEQSLEEKMALMEKSYELAARYNGKQTPSVTPTDDRKDRTSVKPVKRIRQEVVSSLAQPVSDGDFIAGTSEERNTGFHTPVGRTPVSDRNTIAACVHGTQTVSDGQALRVRLLEAMAVDDRLIPKGTVLTGRTRIQGERMDVVITNVEYQGTVIPVELEVYDADGQQGILVPNSLEYDAVREIAAGMGGSMGSSISISTDAGAQIASDLGKGVIQGVSQYITKKMSTVKVTLKAGHRLLLHSPEQ
ncbi:conjugative transposon protein TraM [Parabacteroides distasonis]|uniref:conjugative transposon protein TraM n=1 Tax=Bacteroidales TaxID=171549 RepID=UPI0018AA89D5|nr:conjugative transposon protein TraM [Bacteroides thetaiotaomicron]MDC2214737.1 conjugative transposon protein TraM [Bacteroides thetaiotaomicron]UVS08336.1 conjugative transposon protein TraM [Parabacteroides distasonis]